MASVSCVLTAFVRAVVVTDVAVAAQPADFTDAAIVAVDEAAIADCFNTAAVDLMVLLLLLL